MICAHNNTTALLNLTTFLNLSDKLNKIKNGPWIQQKISSFSKESAFYRTCYSKVRYIGPQRCCTKHIFFGG